MSCLSRCIPRLWLMAVLASLVLYSAEASAQRFGGRGGGREFSRIGGIRGGGGGLTGLIRDEAVQQQLQLTETQQEQLQEIQAGMRSSPAFGELIQRMRAAETDEDRESLRNEMQSLREQQQKAAGKTLRDTLTPAQHRLLLEEYIRRSGPEALLQEDVAQLLKLSPEQQSQLQKLNEQRREERRNQFRQPRDESLTREEREEQREASRQAWNAKLQAVLGESQQTEWGKLAAVEEATTGDSGAAGSSTPASPAATPSLPLPDASQVGSQPVGPVPPSQASFGPGIASRDATGTTNGSGESNAPREVPAAGAAGGPRMSFNFRQAPWTDVLRLFAETSGLTLDLNAVPTGTFTYFDSRSYSAEEALDVLNGYLLPRGFLLVRRNRFLVSVSIGDGVPPNLIPSVSLDELNRRGNHELLSIVLPLQGGEAEKAAAEVEKLLGPQGKVAALPASNALAISDVGRNLRQIVRLFGGAATDLDEVTFRAFPLKRFPAEEASRIVKTLLGVSPTVPNVSAASGGDRYSRYRSYRSRSSSSSSGSGSSSSQASSATSAASTKVAVAVEPRSNSLLVTATGRQMLVIEAVLESIDSGEGPAVASGPLDTEPRLQVYKVNSADAREVTKTLNALMPGVVVNEDGRAGRIHIFAPPAQQTEVEQLIRQLDGEAAGGARSVAVLPLAQLDPIGAAATLRSLFLTDGEEAPTVEADVIGRRLIVRGTADQLLQVKSLLAQLGEDGSGTVVDRATGSGPIRTLSLGGRDPEEILQMLDRVWSASNGQTLRVIRPGTRDTIQRPDSPTRDDSFVPRSLRDPAETYEEALPDSETRPDSAADAPPAAASPAGGEPATTLPARPTESLPLRDSLRRRTPQTPSIRSSTTRDYRASRTPAPAVNSRPETEAPKNGAGQTGGDSTSAHRQPLTTRELTAETAPASSAPVEPVRSTPADEQLAAVFDISTDDIDQADEAEPADAATAAASGSQSDPGPQPDVTGPARATNASEPANDPAGRPGVTVAVIGDQLVLTSSDEAALDRLERLVDALGRTMPVRDTWSVFYLQAADATETAAILEQLFPASSVALSSTTGDTGLLGSLTGGISSLGQSVAGMAGLSGLGSGPQPLRIIPEVRSNALFVTGPSLQVKQVSDFLKVLDAADLPESYRDRVPRFLPVRFADVNEVATHRQGGLQGLHGRHQIGWRRRGTPHAGLCRHDGRWWRSRQSAAATAIRSADTRCRPADQPADCFLQRISVPADCRSGFHARSFRPGGPPYRAGSPSGEFRNRHGAAGIGPADPSGQDQRHHSPANSRHFLHFAITQPIRRQFRSRTPRTFPQVSPAANAAAGRTWRRSGTAAVVRVEWQSGGRSVRRFQSPGQPKLKIPQEPASAVRISHRPARRKACLARGAGVIPPFLPSANGYARTDSPSPWCPVVESAGAGSRAGQRSRGVGCRRGNGANHQRSRPSRPGRRTRLRLRGPDGFFRRSRTDRAVSHHGHLPAFRPATRTAERPRGRCCQRSV